MVSFFFVSTWLKAVSSSLWKAVIMAEDDTDSPSQFTPPRKVTWRDDNPMSDDNYYHCPYIPTLGHHLTFTPMSTPQKSDLSMDEESPSESKFETKGDSFRRKLTPWRWWRSIWQGHCQVLNLSLRISDYSLSCLTVYCVSPLQIITCVDWPNSPSRQWLRVCTHAWCKEVSYCLVLMYILNYAHLLSLFTIWAS